MAKRFAVRDRYNPRFSFPRPVICLTPDLLCPMREKGGEDTLQIGKAGSQGCVSLCQSSHYFRAHTNTAFIDEVSRDFCCAIDTLHDSYIQKRLCFCLKELHQLFGICMQTACA